MNDSIRISNAPGRKIIEVNDSGDTIVLELGSLKFMGELLTIFKEFGDGAKAISAQLESADERSLDEISKIAEQADEACVKIAAKIDGLFGDGTCRKVFGRTDPGIYELTDFLGQVGELIRKFGAESDEINQKIAKHTEKYRVKE